MIILTRRQSDDEALSARPRKQTVRVNQPVELAGSGWTGDLGHHIDFNFKGNDKIDYTIRLTQADIDAIVHLWNQGADQRAELDRELNR